MVSSLVSVHCDVSSEKKIVGSDKEIVGASSIRQTGRESSAQRESSAYGGRADLLTFPIDNEGTDLSLDLDCQLLRS